MRHWILVCLSFVGSSFYAFGEEAPIIGGIQFWSRNCLSAEKCELPAAIGPVHVIRGQISSPQNPKEVGIFAQTIDQDDLRVIYQVFWKIPAEQKPHFVFQQKLLRRNGDHFQALAECSTYASADMRPAFHAGACTGFTSNDDAQQQWGVSFIKAQ
jgi:hypothetical protein